MDEDRGAKIDKLQTTLKELDAAGIDQSVLEPLRKELADLKVADLKENIDALKSDMGMPPAPPLAPPPGTLPPPPHASAVSLACVCMRHRCCDGARLRRRLARACFRLRPLA